VIFSGCGKELANLDEKMAEILELNDADFTAQMQGLIDEAKRSLNDRAPATKASAAPNGTHAGEPGSEPEPAAPPTMEASARSGPSVPEMLRPIVQGVQAIGRATGENTQILGKLEKAAGDAADAHRELPQIVTELKQIVEQRNAVSRQMFDALHEELKTYKDGFLLDTIHRPMIRDLISLYDDLSLIHGQMNEAVSTLPGDLAGTEKAEGSGYFQRFQNILVHVEHNLHFILEVLARLEVVQLPIGTGKLNKHTQRAVAVEMAEQPSDDMEIARSVKRGFLWKDRVVRAEEVVVKKWKEGFLTAMPE
jgi:molecular chaperone GrpE (heat shock protein)